MEEKLVYEYESIITFQPFVIAVHYFTNQKEMRSRDNTKGVPRGAVERVIYRTLTSKPGEG